MFLLREHKIHISATVKCSVYYLDLSSQDTKKTHLAILEY